MTTHWCLNPHSLLNVPSSTAILQCNIQLFFYLHLKHIRCLKTSLSSCLASGYAYTAEHEWASSGEESVATVGISCYAQVNFLCDDFAHMYV